MFKKIYFTIVLMLLTISLVFAQEQHPQYQYSVTVDRIKDGDTFNADLYMGLGVSMYRTVRCLGYNAPETRTRDLEEKRSGIEATLFFSILMEDVDYIVVKKPYVDSFGRVLGEVYLKDGSSVSELMINEGFTK